MRVRAPSAAAPPPPLPLLLLLLLLLSPMAPAAARSIAWSRGYPGPTAAWPPPDRRHEDDPTRAQQLELIEHVLHNDRQWGRVLRQGVKLTARNRPPYHGDDDAAATDPEVRALLRLVDADATAVTPLPVLQRAARLWWLGSYVEYAAYVTRTAFACHAAGTARLAVHLAMRAWDAAVRRAVAAGQPAPETAAECAAHGLPAAALPGVAALLAALAAKVAAVHGDLTAVADALFENADARLLDPGAQYRALATARRRFDEHLDERCAPVDEQDAFLNAGFGAVRGTADALDAPEAIADTLDRVVAKAMETYDALDVDAVPLDGWASVTDYENPVVKCARPYLQSYHEADPFEVQTDTRLREIEKLERKRALDGQQASRDDDGGGGAAGPV